MDLSDDVEFIIMDDGSEPPLQYPDHELKNLYIHCTNDKRPWTVELARNKGAKLARGEYLLMTDIDYIIPKDAIESALLLKEDKMRFKRKFGVLDENGDFTEDYDVLRKYGLLEERIKVKGNYLPPHPNNFVMRKETFWKLGGYREDLVERTYPNKGDTYFKRVWAVAFDNKEVTMCDYRPTLYMFPNGQYCGDVDYNPFGLFHNLTRKTERNVWYVRMLDKMPVTVSD
jgi:hypothetical protein